MAILGSPSYYIDEHLAPSCYKYIY